MLCPFHIDVSLLLEHLLSSFVFIPLVSVTQLRCLCMTLCYMWETRRRAARTVHLAQVELSMWQCKLTVENLFKITFVGLECSNSVSLCYNVNAVLENRGPTGKKDFLFLFFALIPAISSEFTWTHLFVISHLHLCWRGCRLTFQCFTWWSAVMWPGPTDWLMIPVENVEVKVSLWRTDCEAGDYDIPWCTGATKTLLP